MENYTRIIGNGSSNIRTPTAPEITQGNDQLTPYESAKNNGYYNEMSQQIGNISEEITNVITSAGLTPDATLTQLQESLGTVNDLTVNGKLNTAPSTATISTGSIAYARAYMVIDTEAAAATDDLDTITGGTAGDVLRITSANNARDITITHLTGNIFLRDGADITLIRTEDSITLVFDGTQWVQDSRSLGSDFTSSQAASGYTFLPNGLIKQWSSGSSTTTGDSTQAITFPIAFPNNVFQVCVSTQGGGVNSDAWFQEVSKNTSSITVRAQWLGTGSVANGVTPIIFAIGN